MLERIWRIVVVLLVVTVPVRAAEPDRPLRIAIAVVPNTLNPMLRTQTTEAFIGSLIFDGLVRSTPDGTIVPVLAATVPTRANGGISRDGLTITYHLRHGVRWHDGTPFGSRDVAFTQSAAMNPNNNVSARESFSYVARIDTPDDETVVVHLRTPFSPFVAQWIVSGLTGVLPAHLLERLPEINDAPFDAAPIGTGAYRFERWERGRQIVLRANDDYFFGKPRIERIVLQQMGDENTRNVALRTGETDWSFEAANISVREFAGNSSVATRLLAVNGYFGLRFQTQRPPLDDVRVRRAIAYALDRETMVRKLSGASVTPVATNFGPATWAYDPALPPLPFDPARSRALLADAGWRPGPGGTLARDGKALSLQLVYAAGRPEVAAYAVNVQAMLGAVGITVDLKSQQSNVLFAPLAQHGTVFSGDFDLALLGFYGGADPDDRISFACESRPPNGFNVSRWCDSAFDRATADALRDVDRAARKRDYARASRRLLAAVPEAFFFAYKDPHLVRPGVRIDDGTNLLPPYLWTMP